MILPTTATSAQPIYNIYHALLLQYCEHPSTQKQKQNQKQKQKQKQTQDKYTHYKSVERLRIIYIYMIHR